MTKGRPPGSKNKPKDRKDIAEAIGLGLTSLQEVYVKANMLLFRRVIDDSHDWESAYIRNFIACYKDFASLLAGEDLLRNATDEEALPRRRFGT